MKCAFIRIVEDSVQEGTEQFSVLLTSTDPHVTFRIREATVTIIEETTTSSELWVTLILKSYSV